jgi:hypothetical protein
MIAIDEIKATANRLKVLADNTKSVEEKVMANFLCTNLIEIAAQANLISKSPQFKQQVEQEQSEMKGEKCDQ